MTHLTEPELYMLLDSTTEAPSSASTHIASCDHCRAELTELRASFTLLRETTSSYAAANLPREWSSAQHSRRQPLLALNPMRARWAAAALLLAAGAAGLSNLHHSHAPIASNTSPATAQPSPSDEALLQSVSDAVDQPVPTSLSILAESSSQAQSTASTQKAQSERNN